MRGVPEQFVGFFDDAPTFPPGLAPLPDAIAHRLARRGHPLVDAVGPLVLALDDLDAADRLVAASDAGVRVPVSLVVPAGRLSDALAAVARLGRPGAHDVPGPLDVVSLEVKTEPDADWPAELDGARSVRQNVSPATRSAAPIGNGIPLLYVELTASQVMAGGVRALAERGLRLKFRTGGVRPELFPSVAELAAVIVAVVEAAVPFKLTAGLHEAVRYTNPATGCTHHGFLNIAAATDAARRGGDVGRVAAILVDTDAEPLVTWATADDGTWRDSFRSFGTCSVGEPAASLHRLGLFPAGLS